MKRALAILLAALILLLAAGCNMRNNLPARPQVTQPGTTAMRPAASGSPSYATVAPDKTASQDTAGAVTRLPEAATAQGATATP